MERRGDIAATRARHSIQKNQQAHQPDRTPRLPADISLSSIRAHKILKQGFQLLIASSNSHRKSTTSLPKSREKSHSKHPRAEAGWAPNHCQRAGSVRGDAV